MPDISLHQKIVFLADNLGPTATALLSGTRRRDDVRQWLDRRLTPTEEQSTRLSFTYELFQRVREIKGDEDNLPRRLMCTWMVGDNVASMQISPLIAIRHDQYDEVEKSFRRMLDHDYFGAYDDEIAAIVAKYHGIILI